MSAAVNIKNGLIKITVKGRVKKECKGEVIECWVYLYNRDTAGLRLSVANFSLLHIL